MKADLWPFINVLETYITYLVKKLTKGNMTFVSVKEVAGNG